MSQPASRLGRFARLMYRRRKRVLAIWLGVLVVLIAAAARFGGEFSTDYTIPGSQSARAFAVLAKALPQLAGDHIDVVVRADDVTGPEVQPKISALLGRMRAADRTHIVSELPIAVSPDRTVGLVRLQLSGRTEQIPVATANSIIDLAASARAEGLTVEVGGATITNAENHEAGSEQIGMIAALVILLLAFGSILAAGLPIAIALFGLGGGLALGRLLNHLFAVPEWAPQLVSMIGIGIGIDYALFVVVRYRSALKACGDPQAAVVEALTTAGRAVLFAGGTVIVSLLGLCAMGMHYLYGTAAVTVVGVLVVLIAALTLLPALLGFCGTRIDRLRLPVVGAEREDGLWARWSRLVQRRPLVTGAVALVALVALSASFASMRFGYPDAGSGSTTLTSRRAYDLIERGFGAGANGPLVIAVEADASSVAAERVAAALRTQPDIAFVMPPMVNRDRGVTAIVALPATGPQNVATERTIRRLRADVLTQAAGPGARVSVGGTVAAFVDESSFMGPRMPWFIGAVIALSFFLLLMVFRAVLVAIKAAIMNLLAIGAAYGVMAMALRGGWFGGLLGIDEATPIPAWAPMMMFALLFGLSMDYEVFLLTRIREEYVRTKDNAHAVAFGIAKTGRVITAAAAIMVTVFATFMLGDAVLMKVLGLGLAVAVALDATLVRMVLVPSSMELLGERNWWMPRWLDRALPHLDVEGSHHTLSDAQLEAELEALVGELDLAIRR